MPGYTNYEEYLHTREWRRVRNHALDLAHYRCPECGGRRGLEVHHLTYERLGYERQSDLRVLCRDCHEAEHQRQKFNQLDVRERFTVLMKLAGVIIDQDGERESVAAIADRMKGYCAKLRIVYDSRAAYDAAEHVVRLRNLPLTADKFARIEEHRKPERDDPFSQPGAAAALLERLLGPLDTLRIKTFPKVYDMPAGAVDELRCESGLWNRPDIAARGYLRPPTVEPLPLPRIVRWATDEEDV